MKLAPLFIFIALFTIGFANEVEASEATPSIVYENDSNDVNESAQKHSISMELLGRAGLYSFNYDYLIQNSLALGAGLSTYTLSSGEATSGTWILPIYANYYVNEGLHRFFATGGASIVMVSGKVNENNQVKGSGLGGSVGFGYEYKSRDGFLFRAAPYLLVGQTSGGWIGVSLGYSI